ncbi:four helix bundle protein [Candidatus Peregrinibacteria bacterium]|nr:four helix bundle protein [Candidatus Peregrinibacteria bacterium]
MGSAVPQQRIYDLEERTFKFAERSRNFLSKLPRTIINIEHVRQLARCTASVGANYVEANDALGKKDFSMKLKTSRREAKECIFWFRLLELNKNTALETERTFLLEEAQAIVRIFSAMLRNFQQKQLQTSKKAA